MPLEVAPRGEPAREVDGDRRAGRCGPVDVGAARERQPEQPGDLVEGLPRRVVDRRARAARPPPVTSPRAAARSDHRRPASPGKVGQGPCSSWSTATWAARWLTPYSGFPSPAPATWPRRRRPAARRPARALPSPRSRRRRQGDACGLAGALDGRHHRLEVGARGDLGYDATETRVLLHRDATASASRVWPRTMPTPVSSQEVSMPSTRGSDNDAVTAPLCTGPVGFPRPRGGGSVPGLSLSTSRESEHVLAPPPHHAHHRTRRHCRPGDPSVPRRTPASGTTSTGTAISTAATRSSSRHAPTS